MNAELRRAARATGEKTFDTGLPCIRGHISPRWTVNGMCIACKRENDCAYNRRNVEAHRARSRASVERRREAVREAQRQYHRANPARAIARARQWRLANPARHKALQRSSALRLHDRTVARQARWRREHPEAVRASRTKWKRANPIAVRAQDAVRRARKHGVARGCRRAYRRFVTWVRTAPRIACYWCKASTLPRARHIDHVIPLSRGGADAVANLCVACPTCNLRKGARMPEEHTGQAELSLA